MRILTNSPSDAKGLISIVEADDNVSQAVVFCIPIDLREAERIRNTYDFESHFFRGISTKIKDRDETNTIYLDYISPRQNKIEVNPLPKFVANIKGYQIDFYLSLLNFVSDNRHDLNIDFYYSGKYLNDDLFNKRLVIVEPNWRQLDSLFINENVLFTDWK